jgi:hypothetical protein
MAKFRITGPDGGTYEVNAPDGASEADVLAYAKQNLQPQPKAEESGLSGAERVLRLLTPGSAAAAMLTPEGRKDAAAGLMGFLRGGKDVIDTGAEALATGYDKLTGADQHTLGSLVTGQRPGEAARVKAMNEAGKQDFQQQYGDSAPAQVGRVGGQIAITAPVGGALGQLLTRLGLARLGAATASGGMTTGAEVAPTLTARAVDLGIRSAGGAINGGATAGLVDPESAGTGAAIGAALPVAAKVAGAAGAAAANVVKPFTKRGQEQIAADALRQFSTNPEALANLRAAEEMIPGSAPTTVAAAGDEGLAGLSRTLQSVSPHYAAELSSRASAQNAARTAALEDVAGNTGKLALAQEARDAATAPMRETVLDAAGQLHARPVLDAIDRLIAKPDNAGELAQSALNRFRDRIAQFSPEGQIDARALYAIRKDINQMLQGKLQGEAGNLRYAAGQLNDVKGIIDDAIDQASRRVNLSDSRAVVPYGANIERAGAQGPAGSMQPRPTWRGYLEKYTDMSIPVNQMEKLDEVMRAVSTGAVDKEGNAVLSAAKLNNYLRNNAQDLQKALAPEQLGLLRRLAADLNASQLASNAGKAVGSNTVQNLAGANLLNATLGATAGGSTPARAVLGRLLQLPYGASNAQIQEKLAAALLDPKEAARLWNTPEGFAALKSISRAGAPIAYRAAPLLAAQ